MFHDNLLSAFAIKRDVAGQHFKQDDSQRVNIYLFSVDAISDFGCHVMEGPDGFGLP